MCFLLSTLNNNNDNNNNSNNNNNGNNNSKNSQLTGFYVKCNTGLEWVNSLQSNESNLDIFFSSLGTLIYLVSYIRMMLNDT